MKEIERARSIYERAIDVDHRCIQIWLRYAEMEMRNKQVNHARNVWDRAVTLLPRAQQLWYKYAYMEEVLQNITACRAVFERWMEWEPDPQAWHSYINFEYRYKVILACSFQITTIFRNTIGPEACTSDSSFVIRTSRTG